MKRVKTKTYNLFLAGVNKNAQIGDSKRVVTATKPAREEGQQSIRISRPTARQRGCGGCSRRRKK